MAKVDETKLPLFTNRITEENKRDLQVYAANENMFLYEAFNEALSVGLKVLMGKKKAPMKEA